jgi:hypothetical protein
MDIFVGTDGNLNEFISELQSAINLQLRKAVNGDLFFEYSDEEKDILVLQHDLEDDRDLLFSQYPVQISVRALDIWDAGLRETKTLELAQRLFAQLKKTGRYRLMLVDDLQKCIAKHQPTKAGSARR